MRIPRIVYRIVRWWQERTAGICSLCGSRRYHRVHDRLICRGCGKAGCTSCLWGGGCGYCTECWKRAIEWQCCLCKQTHPISLSPNQVPVCPVDLLPMELKLSPER